MCALTVDYTAAGTAEGSIINLARPLARNIQPPAACMGNGNRIHGVANKIPMDKDVDAII